MDKLLLCNMAIDVLIGFMPTLGMIMAILLNNWLGMILFAVSILLYLEGARVKRIVYK